jgi:uncharacterized protein
MLGRLARYLRFVGCDTVYARALSDEAIVVRARAEDRVVLTRDRALARRADRSVRIESPHIGRQWAELRKAWPDLPSEVRFERCTLCNGLLRPYRLGSDPAREAGVPLDRAAHDLQVWACAECGHLYWEGSHTATIRARLAAWATEAPG